MKKSTLFTLLLFFSASFCVAQEVILDYESPQTTYRYEHFGSSLEFQAVDILANPNPNGVNSSANVAKQVRPAFAEFIAGTFADQPTPITTSGAMSICVDVLAEQPGGTLSFKLEKSTNGSPNWIVTRPITKVEEWEKLCFDISELSFEAPFTSAEGGIFNGTAMFFDFGTENDPQDRIYYFDNLQLVPVQPVPTMGQWALFLFSLVVVTLAVVGIYNVKALQMESDNR